jgi:hypothetical protein
LGSKKNKNNTREIRRRKERSGRSRRRRKKSFARKFLVKVKFKKFLIFSTENRTKRK